MLLPESVPFSISVQSEVHYLITKFQEKKEYTELEINMILKKWHSFGDHSLLRRELYDAFLLDRTPDCKKYWVHKEQ